MPVTRHITKVSGREVIQECFDAEQTNRETVYDSGGGRQDGPGINPYLNLDCQPGYDDVMESLVENREPRWGQLGNKQSILNDVNQAMSGMNGNFELTLLGLSNYFNVDRKFETIGENVIELSGSVKRDRYLYTNSRGWIDMHHFFVAAFLSEGISPGAAESLTTAGEVIQAIQGSPSGYSYEDLPSNKAGIDFFLQFGKRIREGNLSLESALNSFLTSIQATDPENVPNFDVIPHAIGSNVPKNHVSIGLTGETLRQRALQPFCEKMVEVRNLIINAHKKIPHTSKL